MNKRLKEIMTRKLEIRKSLEKNDKVDLAKIEAELRQLEQEEQEIRNKQDIASKINIGEILTNEIPKPQEKRSTNKFDSVEYRQAFMEYVTQGKAIPQEFRANAITSTTDVGAVIPNTTLNKIIEKMEAVGMILPLVTRTAYKGGVTIPTSSVKPVATWVAEGKGSDKQKKTTGSVTFSYNKLRCAVAVTLETDTMALSAFESALISNVSEAMVKAIEQAIISGTGTGQPKGILAETAADGQAISTATCGYADLIAAESALPPEYENGAVWVMTKKTFMTFIGEVDSNKQPIARVNYGINGKPERVLLGRQVKCCNYLNSYANTLTAGNVFAFLFNFNDYVLNTNFAMGIKKYEDNETDDQVMKSIMLVDGKVIDKNSLVTLAKKA